LLLIQLSPSCYKPPKVWLDTDSPYIFVGRVGYWGRISSGATIKCHCYFQLREKFRR